MLKRFGAALGLSLLTACAGVSPASLDDICRDSTRCQPVCGSVATGASPHCSGWENEGRTRG